MAAFNFLQLALVIASAVYMTAAAPPLTMIAPPGSSEKRCQVFDGVQGQGTSLLQSHYKNAFTDDLGDGNRVVFDEEKHTILIVTGKDSLPESLVTVSIKAPGATKDDGPYVYRLLQNDYCSYQLKEAPVAGSVFTVFKGPVPPIPKVKGGPCTTYGGASDPNAVEMASLNDVFWSDGNTNGEGTVLGFDKKSKNITIVTGKESKDTSLVMFTINTVYTSTPTSGSSTSMSTGYRIRSDDNCTATLPEALPGKSVSYSVTVGTPLLY